MRTAEERSRFKAHFFKLGQGRVIGTGDVRYWQQYWGEPSSTNDVFELFTVQDVRGVRDHNICNFVTLVRVLVVKMCGGEGDDGSFRPREVLNCMRWLSKVLPVLFELRSEEIERRLFWTRGFDPMEFVARGTASRAGGVAGNPASGPGPGGVAGGAGAGVPGERAAAVLPGSTDEPETPVLGAQLISRILTLLFYKGFTLESSYVIGGSGAASGAASGSTRLWEAGIGSSAKYNPPNLVIDANRTETLRLLLTILSKSFYQPPSGVVAAGNRFLTVLVCTTPRIQLLTLVCSLLNLVCRSARQSAPAKGAGSGSAANINANGLQFSNSSLTEVRHLLVTYSVQLLAIMVVYPMPPSEELAFLESAGIPVAVSSSQSAAAAAAAAAATTDGSAQTVRPPASPTNLARVYFGKLHKENELHFIATHLMNVLRRPMEVARAAEDSRFGGSGGGGGGGGSNSSSAHSSPSVPNTGAFGRFAGASIGAGGGGSGGSGSIGGGSAGAAAAAASAPPCWIPETTMLLWELFQCNKNFRALMKERYVDELLLLLLYHVYTFHHVSSLQNFVRVCTYFMLYLTSDTSLTEKLCEPLDAARYDRFPAHFKCSTAPKTMRDVAVSSICVLLNASAGSGSAGSGGISLGGFGAASATAVQAATSNPSTAALFITTLVETLYNLIPVVSSRAELQTVADSPQLQLSNANPAGGLSYGSCAQIMSVVTKFSTRSFILEKPFHADLLALVVRAVVTAIVKNPRASRMLLYNILKNEKGYDMVWTTIHNLKSEYFSGDTLMVQQEVDEENEQSETDQDGADDDTQSISSVGTAVRANGGIYMNSHHENSKASLNDVAPGMVNGPPVTAAGAAAAGLSASASSSSLDLVLRPNLPTGMSSRAKEKLPRDAPLGRSWGGNDSLRIILTMILPHIKLALGEAWGPAAAQRRGTAHGSGAPDAFTVVKYIEALDWDAFVDENKRQINYDFLPGTPIETLRFNWSYLSLGWYLSLLYGNVYNTVDNVRVYTGNGNRFMKNITSSLASITSMGWAALASASGAVSAAASSSSHRGESNESKETVEYVNRTLTTTNHWAATEIVLFKIQAAKPANFLSALNTKLISGVMGGGGGGGSGNAGAIPGSPGGGHPGGLGIFPGGGGGGGGGGHDGSAPGSPITYSPQPQAPAPGTPHSRGGVPDMTRRLSDFRLNNNHSRSSISSMVSNGGTPVPPGSHLSTPIEEQESYFSKRSSISSLHSLNLMNRSNDATPRNSISTQD